MLLLQKLILLAGFVDCFMMISPLLFCSFLVHPTNVQILQIDTDLPRETRWKIEHWEAGKTPTKSQAHELWFCNLRQLWRCSKFQCAYFYGKLHKWGYFVLFTGNSGHKSENLLFPPANCCCYLCGWWQDWLWKFIRGMRTKFPLNKVNTNNNYPHRSNAKAPMKVRIRNKISRNPGHKRENIKTKDDSLNTSSNILTLTPQNPSFAMIFLGSPKLANLLQLKHSLA